MGYTAIAYEVDHDAGVLTITLDRPEQLNAVTRVMIDELLTAFDAADADDDVRAVIVTGSGRAFCAGTDLSGGDTTFKSRAESDTRADGSRRQPRDPGGPLALRIFDSLKPVIAAVNGAAVGLGATMTLPMDVRFAAETAKFGFVFNRRGISPDACSSWFLPRVVGISGAMEWVVLGADHPAEAHRLESDALASRGRSADAVEGVTSFLEKRPARFPVRLSDGLPDVLAELRKGR